MKKYFILFLLAIALLISCKHNSTDNIYVDSNHYYFDTLRKNDSFQKSFYIYNNTNKDIIKDTILMSCECVNMLYSFDKIKSKSKDSIVINFTLTQVGYINRGFTLLIKDRQEPFSFIIDGISLENK